MNCHSIYGRLNNNHDERGESKLIQTRIIDGSVGEVQFIEGFVALGKVKLNVYCFVTDGILIDTGAPRLLPKFKGFFEQNSFDKVMLTHSHEDHVGGVAYLQHTYEIPIYMNRKGIEHCAKKANYPFYRKVFWGKRKPFKAYPLGKTFQSRRANWDVIETPGHAADHVAFLNRDTGQLFTGDLFVHPQTKLVLRDESIPTIIRSIKSVLVEDFDEVFCCHAGYVENGRKMLLEKLRYLEDIQGKIFEMDKKGYKEREIQSALFSKRYPITYMSLGEWSSLNIIRSVLHSTNNG